MTRWLGDKTVAEIDAQNKIARAAWPDRRRAVELADGRRTTPSMPERKPKRAATVAQASAGEQQLADQLRACQIYGWQCEYKFCPGRRFRLDFAWPAQRLAVEIEGGVWTEGRHTRGSGFVADIEKYNELSILGWRLFRYTPEMVKSGAALKQIEIALKGALLMSTKVICGERNCGWHGTDPELLSGVNPFNPEDSIVGCPKCLTIDSALVACDEPACWEQATCGTPVPDGYRRTCGKHQPKGTT